MLIYNQRITKEVQKFMEFYNYENLIKKGNCIMTLQSLLLNTTDYPPNTEIKIVVNDTEQDIRCLIFDKATTTLYLADATYSN